MQSRCRFQSWVWFLVCFSLSLKMLLASGHLYASMELGEEDTLQLGCAPHGHLPNSAKSLQLPSPELKDSQYFLMPKLAASVYKDRVVVLSAKGLHRFSLLQHFQKPNRIRLGFCCVCALCAPDEGLLLAIMFIFKPLLQKPQIHNLWTFPVQSRIVFGIQISFSWWVCRGC